MNRLIIYFLLSFGIFFLAFCKKDAIQNDVVITPKPLIDFVSEKYRGFQGGLYPNTSNQRPTAHNEAGVAIAQSVKPLNSSGLIDELNGNIVWMSLGMSNTTKDYTLC